MSYESKYIIASISGVLTPIVFPEHLVHADVADALGARGKVSGAGFCTVDDEGYHCYGESTSLNVKSNYDVDSKKLNQMLGVMI
jgi:hypothetical protein